jgi:hypothetical protein
MLCKNGLCTVSLYTTGVKYISKVIPWLAMSKMSLNTTSINDTNTPMAIPNSINGTSVGKNNSALNENLTPKKSNKKMFRINGMMKLIITNRIFSTIFASISKGISINMLPDSVTDVATNLKKLEKNIQIDMLSKRYPVYGTVVSPGL